MHVIRLSIKKVLFPVQRVAIISASQAAAISLFFSTLIFFFVRKYCPFLGKKCFCKNEKKSLQSHLFESPGRYTGNRIIFMDSLMQDLWEVKESDNRIAMLLRHDKSICDSKKTPQGCTDVSEVCVYVAITVG